MPNYDKDKYIGGLATMVVGINDYDEMFICKNFWGDDWGSNGLFYLPFDYLLNPELSSEFYVIVNDLSSNE